MKRILATLVFCGIVGVFPINAFAFDPDYIISDDDMQNPFALDRNQIQTYLDRGFLGTYKTLDFEGVKRYATDIIWRAAQLNKISPKFLLVLLQKEQSLVEDDAPTDRQLDWATGYAVCDDCSKDDASIQRWKGFGKQINSAALQFSEGYLADIEDSGTTQGKYGPDVPVLIDSTIVTPENAATAAMYAYTPHIHGNLNFVNIWDRWFGAEYPSGSLLQAVGQDGVYLIQYGYKRAITSKSALLSRFNPSLILPVSAATLENYPDGSPISFPNYSLLKDDNGNIYLLVDDALRKIDSMTTFRAIGFNEDEITRVTSSDITAYETGTPITAATIFPQGTLLQLANNGAVFYVRDGVRQPIFDKTILDANFSGMSKKTVASIVIEQYKEGKPVKLPDGYLVKSITEPTVYVISDGMRRAIDSEQTFLAYGWSWGNIVTVSDVVINLHPLGDAIAQGAE